MRDLVFVGFLFVILGFGFRRPFLFVLGYIYVDTLTPQQMMYTGLSTVPWSLIAAGLAVLGWLAADDKRDMRIVPRQVLIVLLMLYCGYTTMHADFPVEAQDKWEWVWKGLVFAAFLPLTLRTRVRIEALLMFLVLSAGALFIVGGIKTLASGGGYGSLNLIVDSNSGLFEGSTASMAAVSLIPILLWYARFGTVFPPDWRVKTFCYALVFACMLMPIGTQARTGLLCIALLYVLILRETKRRFLYLTLTALVALAAVPLLPSAYTERMDTLKSYKADASASTRIAVWQWTWEYAKQHPMGGGFDAYRQNHIRYDKVSVKEDGAGVKVERELEVDKARAYHSAYFEMLGEQGWPGLTIWLLIHLGGVFRMEVLRRRYMKSEPNLAWAGPLAIALQQAHLIYLLGSSFVAIALNPFIYMIVGAEIGLDTYLARRRAASNARPFRVAKAAAPVGLA